MTFEEWWEQVEAYGLGLPEGYVLVPVEPTAKMLAVGRKAVHEADIWEVYQAMIQAAQDNANALAVQAWSVAYQQGRLYECAKQTSEQEKGDE